MEMGERQGRGGRGTLSEKRRTKAGFEARIVLIWQRKMPLDPDIGSKVAAAAARNRHVRVAFVFGSHVNGTLWAESDLDVAVRWTMGLDEPDRLEAQLELIESLTDGLGALGAKSDIVDIDDASSAVVFRAISEGACVFARSEAERVDAVVRTCRRYDDDAPMRALFRRSAIDAARKMNAGTDG